MFLKHVIVFKPRISTMIFNRYMGKFHEEHKKGGYHGKDPLNHNFETMKKVLDYLIDNLYISVYRHINILYSYKLYDNLFKIY